MNTIPTFELPPTIQQRVDADGAFFQQHPDTWMLIRDEKPGELIDKDGHPYPGTGKVAVFRLTVHITPHGPVRVRIPWASPPTPEMRRLYRNISAHQNAERRNG